MQPSVKSLFIKTAKGNPMVAVHSLTLKKGYGIENDINANKISPRQVLITRQEDLDEFNIQPGAIRENITTIGIPIALFHPGNLLIIGATKIRLTFYCEPCKRITPFVNPKKIIKKRGILGVIIKSGEISLRDKIKVQENVYAPLPEEPYKRFLNFIAQTPNGKVVTYKEIIACIGVANSYMRIIPAYLKKTTEKYPIHRIVDTKGYLIEKYVLHQREQLKQENVEIEEKEGLLKINLEKHLWQDDNLYQ